MCFVSEKNIYLFLICPVICRDRVSCHLSRRIHHPLQYSPILLRVFCQFQILGILL